MNTARLVWRSWTTSAGVIIAIVAQCAWAQTPVPAGEKVTGSQLQAWLDQKFSYAGVNHSSGCLLLNTGEADRRVLFVRCPNGWAEKLVGTIRVVGETMCTNFPIPNTPPGDDCVTWHSVGQWKFEQRKGGALDTSVVVLPAGLAAGK